ncbi:MAG: low molecular weight protein-tyrosine-phosphatase [Anaerolineales bacterium]
MRICFVCLGNIVRSPLAEHMFNHLAEEMGVDGKYEVDSAGTSAYHVGEAPDARMRQVAREQGLMYTGRARQFQKRDFDRCDLIVAMDMENRRVLESMAATPAQKSKIRLMREFDPQGGPDEPVPDPYYGGAEGFRRVYDIVERSVRGLLEALESGQGV